MIELGCILTCDDWPSEALLQIFSGVACDGATSLSNSFVGIEAHRLLLLRKLPRGNFGKLIEREFCRTHVIPETFLLEPFEILILPGGHTGPGASELVCENRILLTLLNATVFPLVGELLSGADGLKPLIDPFAGITPALVSGNKPIYDQFGIKRFLNAFPTNLC